MRKRPLLKFLGEKKAKIKLKLSNSATVSRFAPSIEKYFGQVQFVKLGEIDR